MAAVIIHGLPSVVLSRLTCPPMTPVTVKLAAVCVNPFWKSTVLPGVTIFRLLNA